MRERRSGALGPRQHLIAGVLIGLVSGAMCGLLVASWTNLTTRVQLNKLTDELVSAVVASSPLAAGDIASQEKVSERRVPADVLTRSVIRPAQAGYMVSKEIDVPVLAGDLLYWQYFETSVDAHMPPGSRESLAACRRVVNARGDLPREKSPLEIRARVTGR